MYKLKMTSHTVTTRYAKVAKIDEGWVPKVYKNYKGLPTLGYGHLVTESSQKALTELGVSKDRAQRILKGKGRLTHAEGERLLLKNVGRKEREIAFILGKQRYNKLSTDKKVAMLGLRFRGDFAKYNNPTKGVLSKEYKHAVTGRYDLAAKAMQRRVRNAPIGVRKRVERHTRLLLTKDPKKNGPPKRPIVKGALATAAIATALGALALAIKKRVPSKKSVPLFSHAITSSVPKNKTKLQCPAGKERNPRTGRCISISSSKTLLNT